MRFRVLPVMLAGATLLTMLAACDDKSGDGVASANSSAAATASGGVALADSEAQLKFARCMRQQGIHMDDPVNDGNPSTIQLPRGSTEAERQKILAAAEACKNYLPNGGAGLNLDSDEVEKVRKFAQCIRANGYSDYPDPDSEGRVQLPAGTDPDDPKLKAALSKCQQYAPEIG